MQLRVTFRKKGEKIFEIKFLNKNLFKKLFKKQSRKTVICILINLAFTERHTHTHNFG